MDSPTSTTKPEEIWDMLANPNFGLTWGERLAKLLDELYAAGRPSKTSVIFVDPKIQEGVKSGKLKVVEINDGKE